MDNKEQEQFSNKKNQSLKSFSNVAICSIACLLLVISVLLTFMLTAAADRSYYQKKLDEQQAVINQMESLNKVEPTLSGSSFEKLDVLSQIFDQYSYYAGQKTEEEMITAVLKAYAEATGDLYAEYYTQEEYNQIAYENAGDYEGIGVSVIQTTCEANGFEYQVFQVISIYKGAPAENSDLRVGDYIYCIKVDDTYQTIAALGGYTTAINYVRGEKGTYAEFAVLRESADGKMESIEIRVIRDSFESVSVTSYLSESDPTVGIVRIAGFDLTAPKQFKEAVLNLKAQGVEHFIFDVRYNPGGDLQSIKAVMTYFLQPGDMILSAIDRNENVAGTYVAEPMTGFGDYAACNVSRDEIGMFADLDMVVLCNGSTASAAEVFVATLRDYGMAMVVGETTFGKGIMQTYLPMSWFGDYTGYVKMTTYAYVTKCGVTYHDIGITPHVESILSEEALEYNFYVLPQSKDNQLQAALELFQN